MALQFFIHLMYTQIYYPILAVNYRNHFRNTVRSRVLIWQCPLFFGVKLGSEFICSMPQIETERSVWGAGFEHLQTYEYYKRTAQVFLIHTSSSGLLRHCSRIGNSWMFESSSGAVVRDVLAILDHPIPPSTQGFEAIRSLRQHSGINCTMRSTRFLERKQCLIYYFLCYWVCCKVRRPRYYLAQLQKLSLAGNGGGRQLAGRRYWLGLSNYLIPVTLHVQVRLFYI